MMKHIKNNQKSIGKSFQPMDFKNLKKKIRKPKVLRFTKRKPYPGYGFKNQ